MVLLLLPNFRRMSPEQQIGAANIAAPRPYRARPPVIEKSKYGGPDGKGRAEELCKLKQYSVEP